jgi:hypothetical protein
VICCSGQSAPGCIRLRIDEITSELLNLLLLFQAFDINMKQMEASIQAAQEGVVNRTVAMIEAKAQGFIAAIKELDVRLEEIRGLATLCMRKGGPSIRERPEPDPIRRPCPARRMSPLTATRRRARLGSTT